VKKLFKLILSLALMCEAAPATAAEDSGSPLGSETNVLAIDLPTALQLAGARSLDIRMAREKLAEAQANNESARWQFFPALVPGVGYRRHDNLIQDIEGNIVDVHKESYSVGPVLLAQVDLGDAIYKNLATHQLATAAEFALEGQRQESALAAVRGYFDLIRAQAAVGVAGDSVRIAEDFAAQVGQAVGAGIAFRGDALRADVQADKNRLILRQSEEQVTVASARLVRTLHLEPKLRLIAPSADLVPLTLIATNRPLDALLAQAFAARPETKQTRALVEAARNSKLGAKFGPLIPSLGAQVFAGGLGGGVDGGSSRFGESEDYQFTLGWRIGPGGLFDRGRIRASEARYRMAQLGGERLLDEIANEVVEGRARTQSLSDQLRTAEHAVRSATEALRLASQRNDFAVAVVLERIQAEQDLTRSRMDFLNCVAEFNKAQFALKRALGDEPEPPATAKPESTKR